MSKFNDIAQAVLKEETDTRQNVYRKISDLLSAKGIKSFEQKEIHDIVHSAMLEAYKEGYKAAKENPFK